MTSAVGSNRVWAFENTYSRLPAVLFSSARPVRFREPRLVILNHALANELGIDLRGMTPERAAAVFAGQEIPEGAEPIAQAYAGHQFGGFTMLGDGRAILLGEHRTPSGRLVDIQLKGAGQTRYSRRGDGRAALGPMLREYIISEAMAALGIPTTRSLAVVATGEPVFRETLLQGAVLTRVAASHLRVGTFEYVAALDDHASLPSLRALADYAIVRHDPDLAAAPDRYLAFFRAVLNRQADLIARWQLVGFIHGVMNTDNVAISGETIDYGPCAFMNAYRPDTVYSSIDHGGRYAYGNQPGIGQWNLARFAEALLPLLAGDPQDAVRLATEALGEFPARFEEAWMSGMRAKLGLERADPEDVSLFRELLGWMEQAGADFTNTFRDLSSEEPLIGALDSDPRFQAWHARWRQRLAGDGRPPAAVAAAMRAVNPAVIPRNHRVEEALAAAEQHDDLAPLNRLLSVLSAPFKSTPLTAEYRDPPPDERCYRTFCGT